MRRLVSACCRFALAVVLFLLTLAVCRWAPVHAEPPWDVRVLPLAGPAVLLAIASALAGVEGAGPAGRRRRRPAGPLVAALAAVAAALAIVVAVRGPAGLQAEVSGPWGIVARLPPGPIDVAGPDLREMPAIRKWTIRWDGALRIPETGAYRLWADGRGGAEIRLDGRVVLEAEGERLRAGAGMAIGRGEHRLEVRLYRVGPGPRLRLGWTRPRAGGSAGGRDEGIPPRFLGQPSSPALWTLTDLLALAAAALVSGLSLAVPWDRPRRPPAPAPVTRGEVALSLAGHAVVVIAMSWPLVLDLAGSGVTDRPDGRLNAWILAWDVHALLHEPSRLFDAPIFHPLPDALAFSENLLAPAVLALPAILLGGPVLGYNLILLGSAVVSGLGAQLLVRRASGDCLAAFVAGVFFAAGAHRWIRLAHLHAQVTLFLPFTLLALDRFWESRTLRRSAVAGLLLALQGLSSIYLGAITATAAGAVAAAALVAGLRAKDAVRLAAGFALAALLTFPAVRPYMRMRSFQGMEWTLDDVARYATTPESYAAAGTRLYGAITQRHLDPDRVRDTLFPGLVPLVLGIAGLASAPRRYRGVALLASAAAVVVSLGPETAFYRFIHEHVVLVRGVRALSRFSLLPVLSLAVLSGFALAGQRRSAVLGALALMLAESSNAPIRYAAYAGPSETARWMAGRKGAVAYLPLGERDSDVMLDGIAHFRPLLNGDSGFIPRPYSREMELFDGPLNAEGLRFLRAVGVCHVVTSEPVELPLAASLADGRVYRMAPGPSAALVIPGRPAPALWGGAGVVVDLGGPAAIERVAFELGDGAWVARPRIEISLDGVRWTAVEAEASLGDATLSLVADPRYAKGEVRLSRVTTRYVRLDPRLPARAGLLWVSP